jgi:hypothetical protein
MTQLRPKMLEELQRRNYAHRTAKTYIRMSVISRSIFTSPLTNSVRNRFGTIRRFCFRPRSCLLLASASMYPRSASCSSRRYDAIF